MPRVRRGPKRRYKRKKILAQAKGYFQAKSKLYKRAKEAVDRSQKFAYIGRRLKKRDLPTVQSWFSYPTMGSPFLSPRQMPILPATGHPGS